MCSCQPCGMKNVYVGKSRIGCWFDQKAKKLVVVVSLHQSCVRWILGPQGESSESFSSSESFYLTETNFRHRIKKSYEQLGYVQASIVNDQTYHPNYEILFIMCSSLVKHLYVDSCLSVTCVMSIS